MLYYTLNIFSESHNYCQCCNPPWNDMRFNQTYKSKLNTICNDEMYVDSQTRHMCNYMHTYINADTTMHPYKRHITHADKYTRQAESWTHSKRLKHKLNVSYSYYHCNTSRGHIFKYTNMVIPDIININTYIFPFICLILFTFALALCEDWMHVDNTLPCEIT